MVKVKNIKMERAEGLIEECITVERKTFQDANRTLRDWAITAPKNGAYNKVDIDVVYEDGEKVSFRFDMEYKHTTEMNILQQEIKRMMVWYSGRENNPHCGKEKYGELVERYKKDGSSEEAQKFLENYDISFQW
jgi:hypothetical protein